MSNFDNLHISISKTMELDPKLDPKLPNALDDEEEESSEGRIQNLEIAMNSVVESQTKLENNMGGIMQQLAEMTNLLKATQSAQQGGLNSLQHSGPQSDNGSVVSNMSSHPSRLFDTGKICFVCGVYNSWCNVYKKAERFVTMYTYRGGELKSLSSAQIRSLKEFAGEQGVIGRNC